MWVRVAGYGIALAAGTFLLQWLEYDQLARIAPAARGDANAWSR